MYGDLDRPPLRTESLAHALAPDGWRVEVVTEATSTNALVADRARAGEPAGLCVVAEEQTAGRGRLDRTWVSPARAGLTFSVLLRPVTDQLGWVPLLGGLSVVRAVREQTGVDAVLKWPNDVLVGDRKLAGLLAEAVGGSGAGAVVLGVGLNVSTHPEELPHELATSVAIEGGRTTDRETLLKAVLRGLTLSDSDRSAYRAACSTIGRDVDVHLPGLTVVQGRAEEVDDQGRLVVDGTPYSAGDVVHLR